LNQPDNKIERFAAFMKVIFITSNDEIACDDCYNAIDRYVDMLRAGEDPEVVLPKVKAHLGICRGCDEEFRALIAILEAHADSSEPLTPDK
jgi:hypothetical protein